MKFYFLFGNADSGSLPALIGIYFDAALVLVMKFSNQFRLSVSILFLHKEYHVIVMVQSSAS